MGAPDPDVLARAAENGWVVVSQDKKTLVRDATARVEAGLPMPGVVLIRPWCPVGRQIDELLVVMCCGVEADFVNQVVVIPLQPPGR